VEQGNMILTYGNSVRTKHLLNH